MNLDLGQDVGYRRHACGPPYDSAGGYTRLGFGNQNKALVSRIESAARFGVIQSAGIKLVIKLHVLS